MADTKNVKGDGVKFLKVSSNASYLETTKGEPFFYLGDTAWELIHRLNREEVDLYLSNRKEKGFTVIQAVVLSEIHGLTDPNSYGDLPLIDSNPSSPNEKYFEHLDYIVEKAESLGLFIGLLPTWGKYWKSGKELIFTEKSAKDYGIFLGSRYKNNQIIWVLGGDQNIVTNEEKLIIDALANGLREGDEGNHLITFHPRGPGQSSRQVHNSKWLDFNMTQSSHAAKNHDNGIYIENDRSFTPKKPTLDGEPRYETMPVGFYLENHDRLNRFDAFDVRQAAWWAVLSGACGHTYGDNNIWQMWKPGLQSAIYACVPWFEAIHHPGSRQMGIMRYFMEKNDFHKMIPDQDIIIDGSKKGGSKIRAMRSSDGHRLIVYTPFGEQFTLDQSIIKASCCKQSWFDPRYGIYLQFRLSPRDWDCHSYQSYTPPTNGRGQDWVLVLEGIDTHVEAVSVIGN